MNGHVSVTNLLLAGILIVLVVLAFFTNEFTY